MSVRVGLSAGSESHVEGVQGVLGIKFSVFEALVFGLRALGFRV